MVKELGFVSGLCSPCKFYHKERNVRSVIHGDDFTMRGHSKDLDWFRAAIAAKWQVKIKDRIGPAPDVKVMHVLSTLVEWKTDGIHYEADQRHAQIIVQTLGLEDESKSLLFLV